MATPTVFISYSHKDEEWKDRLVTHLGVLQQEGLLETWDDRRIGGSDDWFPEIEKAIDAASVAILMISANFLNSNFILKEEVPKLLQRREKEGLRVFPVIVKPCAWQRVKWLKPIQARPKDGKPLSGGNEYQIDTDLATIADEVAKIIRPAGSATPPCSMPLGPDKISLAKLPSTSPDLFGREKQLKALNEAWDDPSTNNVVSLVAWGGVGKTALVNKWLLQMGKDNYRGAERVFGWSFYSQGASEGKQNSADQFIAAALQWFGDPDPTQGSPWDKGERLAELVKRQRTLLILDGLEPLQNPPPVEIGKIKDPSLCSLLRELARQNPGLVIITTRLPVDDLKDFVGISVQQTDLDDLSPGAGAAYLAFLGVKGTAAEREEAAQEYKGHALALTLLGRYVVDVYEGDIRKRDLIPKLTDEEEKGAHARKMMEAYAKWFEGKPEQNILCMLGLFDRPAEKGAIQALLAAPRIAGLTAEVQGIAGSKWELALKHLRSARLLAERDAHDPEALDCHPLIREHFGEKLKASDAKAWRKAQGRLYEYYRSSTEEYPDTLEDMTRLLVAVGHGCQAGRHQEALLDVFSRRVDRGEAFVAKKLGAMGSALTALSAFFDPPWREIVSGLTGDSRGYVLNITGFCLRAVGRLAEAVQPMQASLDWAIAAQDWENAAAAANTQSELYLTLGDLGRAIDYCTQAVQLADKSHSAWILMYSLTTLADAMHQCGHVAEAELAFGKAEDMQKERRPDMPILCSFQGFRYCDLLLSQGKYQDVERRVGRTVEWARRERVLLDVALDDLSLGRAHLLHSQREPSHATTESADFLNRAVEGLRQAGQQNFTPLGLLARAELHRVTGALGNARLDLDEALSICTRCGVRLYEANCHLEYARWHLASGDKPKARESLAKAKVMIEEMGYHRRDKEVKELEAQLGDE